MAAQSQCAPSEGDRLVRARVLPVCDNGVENITHATAHAPEKTLQRKLQYFFQLPCIKL